MNCLRSTCLGVFTLSILFLAHPAAAPNKPPQKSPLEQTASKMPLSAATQALRGNIYFERNDGQTGSQVLYLSHSLDYSLFLTRTGATIAVSDPEPDSLTPAAKHSGLPHPRMSYFTLQFAGANPHPQVTGIDELPGKSNYFLGSNPKSWHTQIAQFSKVRYSNLYPGIDLIFYSREGRLEYDLVAAPGADLSRVHIKTTNARATLLPSGDIALNALNTHASAANAPVLLKRPYAYQPAITTKGNAVAPTPVIVQADYALRGDDLSFALPAYDRSRALVIDPALIFSTFITTNCNLCDSGVADIAADSTGVYVTGVTNTTNFPAQLGGTLTRGNGNPSTFVTKIDPTGSHVIYSTILGSSTGYAITLDTSGDAYVSGLANIDFADAGYPFTFPLTSGVFSGSVPAKSGPASIGYATKLDVAGAVIYSTLLQQFDVTNPSSNSGVVMPAKVSVDSQGALYITGEDPVEQNQGWKRLPVTQGAFQTTPGHLFVMKLTPTASGVAYATYIDATATGTGETATGIAVDSSGDAFLSGTGGTGFPTTSGAFDTSTATQSAYVMKLNPSGSAPIYSTLFADRTTSNGLAVDSAGQAVIGGFSYLAPPVTSGAFCGSIAQSGYLAKFNSTGTGLVYSTTLCGSSLSDVVYAVATDSAGAAYAVGTTGDSSAFANILLDPIQSWPTGVVALKLDNAGALQWASFLGSANSPQGTRIVVDSSDDIYVASGITFPTTPSALGLPNQGENGGGSGFAIYSNFLLKIAPSLGSPVPLPLPNAVSFAPQPITTPSSAVDVEIGNYGDAAVATPTISITGDFSQTNDCTSAIAASDKCDVQVTFTPAAAGTRTGTLTVSFGGAAPTVTVALTGTGTAAAVTLSPTSLSFGMQTTGTTSPAQQITVTNSGTAPLIITSIQPSAEFASTNTCGAPIPIGEDCTLQVTFTPTVSGPQSGTLTITDNAPNSPQIVSAPR